MIGILQKAENLKEELDALRPLDNEAEARIMQKFRLDWNYHSNNLEGNSLTYGETKALILFGITAQGKPLKDHFEITGHNEAINWILEVVKDETPLTEKFIRELHTLLLKESSYKEAQTPNGKPMRRKIEVGKYKTQPNHVITVTGETFYFATPEETPAKMQELIEWFRKEKERADVNPIILAALFHYRFIRIHPFDDGNGRVARILMNFILMLFGYPPAIIKTEDKENYYSVLRLADAGELEPFIEYIAQNLVLSLEIMLRGAYGENIEEPEDLDKELALLERRVRNVGKRIISRSDKVLAEFFENSINPLVTSLETASKKFNRFYLFNSFEVLVSDDFPPSYKRRARGASIHSIKSMLEKGQLSRDFDVQIKWRHNRFNQSEFENLSFESSLKVNFLETQYQIVLEDNIFTKYYSEDLSEDEIKEIVRIEFQRHKNLIEKNLSEFEKQPANENTKPSSP